MVDIPVARTTNIRLQTASSTRTIGSRNPIDKALNSSLDISPELEPALVLITGLCQVWRHITVYTVLTQEEILEEGR